MSQQTTASHRTRRSCARTTFAAIVVCGLCMAFLAPDDAEGQNPGGSPPERVSVLVHLGAGADRGALRGFAARNGSSVKYEYKLLPNLVNLRGLPATALSGLTQVQGVVRVEPDAAVQAHMNGSTPLIGGLQSQLAAAGATADGSGVRVCIIDSGIDSDNFMYANRIDKPAGRDFVNNDNNPEDDDGHGSHVAGTVAGGTGINADTGCGQESLQGVAPAATLIGIKVLDADGSGYFSDVIAGIDYCADQNPAGGRGDVINMSLGGGSFSGACDTNTAAAAANAAVDAGVVVVASSGNDGTGTAMGTPACASKVIAVGATYDDDYPNCEFPNQASFSFCTKVNPIGLCTGICTDNEPSVDDLVCFSNGGDELDVVAPGCVTFSADYRKSKNGLAGYCGTSMASPHVAGLAALLLSADPALTPADVRQLIRAGAVDLGAPGFDPAFGHGRIDALGSLSLLGGPCNADADCDDADACTDDTCVNGSCSNTALDCSDGDPCTTDTCSAGTCSSTPLNCDDGDACTTDSCSGGLCVNQGLDCSDGDACTADSCSNGQCVHDPLRCDDGDACTTDTCDAVTGCGHDVIPDCGPTCLPVGASCTDNSDCCGNRCKGKSGDKVCK